MAGEVKTTNQFQTWKMILILSKLIPNQTSHLNINCDEIHKIDQNKMLMNRQTGIEEFIMTQIKMIPGGNDVARYSNRFMHMFS